MVQAVVGEHRAFVGPDEQTGGEGDEKIAVGHAILEEGVAAGRIPVHVGVEIVAG